MGICGKSKTLFVFITVLLTHLVDTLNYLYTAATNAATARVEIFLLTLFSKLL